MEAINQVVGFVLALVLLVALIVAGIGPLKSAINSFKSIGQEESKSLTVAKTSCNELIDGGKSSDGCALSVAKQIFDEDGSSYEAQAWLKKEVDLTTDKTELENALVFANKFYRTNDGGDTALEIYKTINSKLNTDASRKGLEFGYVLKDISDVKLIYEDMKKEKMTDEQYSKTVSLLNDAYDRYQKNTDVIPDKSILSSCTDLVDSAKGWFLDESKVCIISRTSIANGCYKVESGSGGVDAISCTSCPSKATCSIYGNDKVCNADPCHIGCKTDIAYCVPK